MILTILLVIVALIVLVLIIARFTGKSYDVVRQVTINRPKEEVFTYLKHIKNQDYFNKWTMTDPQMKKTFTGTDGTIGFIYAWDGNKKAGKGEQEIKNLVDGEKIDTEVRFEKPFEAVAQTPFILTSNAAGQTTVTWSMHSSMKYPMNAMLLFMNMDKLLGKDMEWSLARLKELLEQK